MPHDLPKSYDPSAIEDRWADYWVKEKLFLAPTPGEAEDSQPIFSMLLPPPNVTGRLHMGHMLNHTEMDIITRWHRMRDFRALWLPGTDHAGIATQLMVERQLAREGKKRQDLGREKFIERVWEWRRQYGGAILEQMRRLGDSVDWEREYFTMDERRSRAVREAFVRLHEQGLIYRGNYIVNWCPRCMTAISDLEVVHQEVAGKLYAIKYPLIGSKDEFVVVATTRPETMLGDVAVAVNPKDERYKRLHGKMLLLPLAGREIPIVADDAANPEFGTGAVKVTPAHDPNDFQIGQRHGLPQISVMNESGHMNANAGSYAGLDRYEARKKVLADLRAQGLLAGEKEHRFSIGKCDRCKSVVEPRLSTQWFVKIQPLADLAIKAVEAGEVRFRPENYAKTYFEWMRNIRDWTISRQLWWGHRIPAWHCADCKHITISRNDPADCETCGSKNIAQESDVLDTWFSSGLLPFSALGWPEKTRDLDVFYPGSLLITGFDILFFWVARMIMLGCWFMRGHKQDPGVKQASGFFGNKDDSVPFREVYIHALVRDAERQKMSKTKGNVVDPIAVIQRYGTDAVRFTLAAMASPGTDIAFSEERTDGYRAFANKIWNAARFLFMNVSRAEQAGIWSLKEFGEVGNPLLESEEAWRAAPLEIRWIFSRFYSVAGSVREALAAYRFHEAANAVYAFFWNEFCDWYLEIIKLRLNFDSKASDRLKREAATALDLSLILLEGAMRLLSPFMPFITEEIWHTIYAGRPPKKSIALMAYPRELSGRYAYLIDRAVEADVAILQELIVNIRNLRAELKVEPKLKVPVRVRAEEQRVRQIIGQNLNLTERLANVAGIEFTQSSLASESGARTTPRFEIAVVYEKQIDIAAQRERLQKEIAKLEGERERSRRQLENQSFLAKAPANVVDGTRKRVSELNLLIEKTRASLEQLP